MNKRRNIATISESEKYNLFFKTRKPDKFVLQFTKLKVGMNQLIPYLKPTKYNMCVGGVEYTDTKIQKVFRKVLARYDTSVL